MELHIKRHVFSASGKMDQADHMVQRIAHTRARLQDNLRELEERMSGCESHRLKAAPKP
jgi:hypothetical protein